MRSRTRFTLRLLGVVLLLPASPALAGPNDAYGPEFACYNALVAAADRVSLRKDRSGSYSTAKLSPISPEGSGSFGLEEVSEDGKSSHVRYFTESGEFDATVPIENRVCITGIGFPSGVGSLTYSNIKTNEKTAKGRFGSVSVYSNDDCSGALEPTRVTAHQTGLTAERAPANVSTTSFRS